MQATVPSAASSQLHVRALLVVVAIAVALSLAVLAVRGSDSSTELPTFIPVASLDHVGSCRIMSGPC